MKTKKELEKQLKACESALKWYACASPHSDKEKESKKGVATSYVADRYFKKYGYNEKKIKVIK